MAIYHLSYNYYLSTYPYIWHPISINSYKQHFQLAIVIQWRPIVNWHLIMQADSRCHK